MIKEIILTTTFTLMLIVAVAPHQYFVFVESSLLTTTSENNETGASPNITGTMNNMTQETPGVYHPSPRGNASLPPPQVIFPTQEELEDYLGGTNVTAPTFIVNNSMGNVTDIQEAPSDRFSYVVFQTKLNGTDHIFLTMIQDPEVVVGASFSMPVELTPVHHGNISHLQIAADIDKAFVVWQDYNSATGLSSIFVSSSMESGKVFRTYRASENNTNAVDPSIALNGLIGWKEECPEPGPVNVTRSLVVEPGLQPGPFCPVYYYGW